MIPAFTESGKERENLSTLARSCAGLGDALITIITIKCVLALGHGNERAGFKMFALIIAVIFILSITITCLKIKEKSTVDVESPSIGQMFRALIQNDQAMTVVVAIVLINCSLYVTSNLLIYFFKYDMGGEGWSNSYTLFNTFGGGVQIISMMIFFPLFRKFMSTIKVFYTSIILAVTGYGILLVMMMAGVTSLYPLLAPAFLIFLAFGMLTVLTTIFLANTVDYGELKNGRRDESVIFSMQTFVVKLASGISAMLAAVCLQVFNISKNTAAASSSLSAGSLAGLRLTMTVLPIIGLCVAFVVFRKKFLLSDEKLNDINKELESRR